MAAVARRLLPVCALALVCAWLAASVSSQGDWGTDSGRTVLALAHGHVGDYLSQPAGVGAFSTLVEAPFAALAGGGLAAYHWACFPCLLIAALVGLYLASIARGRGLGRLGQGLIAVLFVANPLTVEALQWGHPEELLTAALAVAAVAAASEDRPRGATLLLGLALASKQWAVIAIMPTLMALPRQRLRVALAALALAAVLTLPAVLASPDGFATTQAGAAHTGGVVTPWSAWYAVSPLKTEVVGTAPATMVVQIHRPPPLAGVLSHPLIVLLALLGPVAWGLRRRSFSLGGSEAMALLALLALLRCALDPVDNLYYNLPLLAAVIGWDAFDARRWPFRALVGVAAAYAFRQWSLDLGDLRLYNFAYLALLLVVAALIVDSMRDLAGRVSRQPNFCLMNFKFRGSRDSARWPIKAP
jgi:glycosyl transferase family 87